MVTVILEPIQFTFIKMYDQFGFDFVVFYGILTLVGYSLPILEAQSTGATEYTDCISTEG